MGVIALLALGVIIGLGIAVFASRLALNAASDLGRDLGLSPFAIGMTIVAVGTDLPEIANSIIASATGHGDVNVGDSIGSVVTQATLVLGIICLLGGLRAARSTVVTAGSLTILGLVIGAVLIDDQLFSRADGAALITVWIVGTIVMQRPEPRAEVTTKGRMTVKRNLGLTVAWLAVVGAGSALAVESFTRAAEQIGAPEFALSFFVLSLGTSLPELVIAARAVQRSASELALGDLLGSSFVDATLSPGIGPLFFPTALSAGLARSSLLVAAELAVVTAVLARNDTHRWSTGLALIALYFGLYPALIG